jgi:RNA polymerase sigma-70 factor (ECF subfamily)
MALLPLSQAFPATGESRANSLQTKVAELFEEARDDVYRYLLLMGVSPASAQEATQETFLRLYATMRRGEEIRDPRAWIFRVAHNFGLKLRASQHSQVYDPQVEARLSSPDDPEQSLLERERLLRLHQALASLSEQQRRCLFLRLEGLRYPEIGAALGISASTVGEFLRRALARLKKVTHE